MGIFNPDPVKKAERKRRKAQKKEMKAAGLKAQADVLSPPEEEETEDATIEVVRRDGRISTSRARIKRKPSRRQRALYQKVLDRIAALEAEVEDLQEQLEESEAEAKKTTDLMGTGLGVLVPVVKGFISTVNSGDVVHNPWANGGAEALQAFRETANASGSMFGALTGQAAQIGELLLKGYAFYDGTNPSSVLLPDANVIEGEVVTTTPTTPTPPADLTAEQRWDFISDYFRESGVDLMSLWAADVADAGGSPKDGGTGQDWPTWYAAFIADNTPSATTGTPATP